MLRHPPVEGALFDAYTIEQHVEGWPGSGYDRQRTELSARRVNGERGEEIQINIEINEFKNGRCRRMHGSLALAPDIAANLISALAIPAAKLCVSPATKQ